MKIIYTKHARERVKKRRLSDTSIERTIENPDKKKSLPNGEVKFIKQQGTRLYHVVGRYLPPERAWLVVSAWVRGEEDRSELGWLILTAPFKVGWWLGKKVVKMIRSRRF